MPSKLFHAPLTQSSSSRFAKRRRQRRMLCEFLEQRQLLAADIGCELEPTMASQAPAAIAAASSIDEAPPQGESVLSVTLDRRFDSSGFFTQNPDALTAVQEVANAIVARFDDRLSAITPPPRSEITWSPTVSNPSTGGTEALPQNFSVAENEIIIFVGSRNLAGNTLATGGYNNFGFAANCPNAECLTEANQYGELLASRGQAGATLDSPTDFAPAVGTIAVDSEPRDWNFGEPVEGAINFRELIAHELAHVFGFGTAPSWFENVDVRGNSAVFTGTNAIAAYGTAVPLEASNFVPPLTPAELNYRHFGDVVSDVTPTTLESTYSGFLSSLDYAALEDVGWDVIDTTVQFSASQREVNESDGVIQLVVSTSLPSNSPITIPFTVIGNADDYTVLTPDSEVTIQPLETSATIQIRIEDDEIPESNESFQVRLGQPQEVAALGTPSVQTVTILRNDFPSIIQFTETLQMVNEGQTATFTVEIDEARDTNLTIPFMLTGQNTDTNDFIVDVPNVVILAGNTTGTGSVRILDDTMQEPIESVVVNLMPSASDNVEVINNQFALHTIQIPANDGPPTATLAASTNQTAEGNNVTLTATLSEAAQSTITIPVAFGGTAEMADYNVSAESFTIPIGQTSGTITIGIVDDTVREDATETLTVSLQDTDAIELGATTSQTINIAASDVPVTASFSQSQQTVDETVGTVTLSINLSAPAPSNLSIPVTFTGTADLNDYTASANTFEISQGGNGASITLSILDDSDSEDLETIVATLQAVDGVEVAGNSVQTVSIRAHTETLPVLSFTETSYRVSEDIGTVRVFGMLTQPLSSPITVPVTVTGTADEVAGAGTTTVTIPAGTTSGFQDVTIINDSVPEDDETIVLTFQPVEGIAIGDDSTTTITIVDDEINPVTPTLSLLGDDVSLLESDGSFTLTAMLSAPLSTAITVPVSFGGSAALDDFTPASNQIQIDAGQSSGTISVAILDDDDEELSESIIATIGTPTGSNVVLGTDVSRTITVIDNDVPDGTPNRILAPEIVGRAHVIPGDGRPTAILFSAQADTTVRVPLLSGANGLVQLLNSDLQPMGTVGNDGVLQADLTGGELYGLIFGPRASNAIYAINSSAGYDAVFNPAMTNLLQSTDVDASGESTALDALLIINELNRASDMERSGSELTSGEPFLMGKGFMDVNADGQVSATDALHVINRLNANDQVSGEAIPVVSPPLTGRNVDTAFADEEFAVIDSIGIDSTIEKISSFDQVSHSPVAASSLEATESGDQSADSDEPLPLLSE